MQFDPIINSQKIKLAILIKFPGRFLVTVKKQIKK